MWLKGKSVSSHTNDWTWSWPLLWRLMYVCRFWALLWNCLQIPLLDLYLSGFETCPWLDSSFVCFYLRNQELVLFEFCQFFLGRGCLCQAHLFLRRFLPLWLYSKFQICLWKCQICSLENELVTSSPKQLSYLLQQFLALYQHSHSRICRSVISMTYSVWSVTSN